MLETSSFVLWNIDLCNRLFLLFHSVDHEKRDVSLVASCFLSHVLHVQRNQLIDL